MGRTTRADRGARRSGRSSCSPLSTRDIATVFTAADGRPFLSRAAVSKLSEWRWAECQTFLFVDGIAERLQPRWLREPVLPA
jgi:hypothetical protein